ncbi:hypothetical protein MRB53_041183 [Persea americana]|nr:hypothetical protein MRB53_041183 [Persea americana]
MKAYGIETLAGAIMPGGTVSTASTPLSNNSLAFSRAAAELGQNAFLGSRVLALTRSNATVDMVVLTPTGAQRIRAKKLLVTVPPTMDNVGQWDLTYSEAALFSQFTYSAAYTGIITDPGLNITTNLLNYGTATPFQLPPAFGPQGFEAIPFKDYITMQTGLAVPLPEAVVKQQALTALQRTRHLSPAVGVNASSPGSGPTFKAFKSHTPYALSVSTDAIRRRFYDDLYALQGQKSTFWAGAAWHTHISSSLWRWEEQYVLPPLLAAL